MRARTYAALRRNRSRILDESLSHRRFASFNIVSKLRPAISLRPPSRILHPASLWRRKTRCFITQARGRRQSPLLTPTRASSSPRGRPRFRHGTRVRASRVPRSSGTPPRAARYSRVTRWSAPQRSRRRLDVAPLAPVAIYPHCATLLGNGTCSSFTLSQTLTARTGGEEVA